MQLTLARCGPASTARLVLAVPASRAGPPRVLSVSFVAVRLTNVLAFAQRNETFSLVARSAALTPLPNYSEASPPMTGDASGEAASRHPPASRSSANRSSNRRTCPPSIIAAQCPSQNRSPRTQ